MINRKPRKINQARRTTPDQLEQRLGQLEQHIRSRGQATMEISPEPGQHGECIDTGTLVQP
jgi:hypothetical protein